MESGSHCSVVGFVNIVLLTIWTIILPAFFWFGDASVQWLSDQVSAISNRGPERADYLFNALVDSLKIFWGDRSHGVNTSSWAPFARGNSAFRATAVGRPSRSGLFDRRELVKSGHIAKVLGPASLVFIQHTCWAQAPQMSVAHTEYPDSWTIPRY